MKKHLITPLAMLGLLAAVPTASAELLVYEPFNYSVGSLAGKNGGIGFAAGWVNSGGVNSGGYVWNASPNVTFDGSNLNWNGVLNNGFPTAPAGRARFMGAEAVGGSGVDLLRELSSSAAVLAGADGVLWMSAVYSLPNRTFGAGLHIGLASGRMSERSRQFETPTTEFIGVSPYTGSSNVWNSNNVVPTVVASNTGANAWQNFARTLSPTTLPAGDMILIMKFTFGASDMVEAMVFSEDTPLEEITEAAFQAGKTSTTYAAGIDASKLNYLVINQGRFNNAQDEIRIGDSFTDVVNFPPPGAVDVAVSSVRASQTAAPADGTTSSTITVILTDSLGVPVPGKGVTLAGSPGGAVIDPATAVTTDSNGRAVFTVKSSTPGTKVFTATNTTDSLVITQTASVTFVSSADADESTVAAAPLFVDANGTSTSTVTVTLKSAEGVPVAGKNVTLAGSPASAVITPPDSNTSDVNGVATFTVSSNASGTVVFTATDTTDSIVITQTASVNFVGSSNAGLSTVAASPSTVVANGSSTSTITVTLRDVNGFPAAGRNVTLANTAGPQAAVISPLDPVVTNANGVATFTVRSSTLGTETFTATATTGPVVITQTASVQFVNPNTPFAFNVNFWTFTPVAAGPFSPPVESELVGPAGGLGTRWNQFNAPSGANLLDPTGVATGVGFTTNFSEGRAGAADSTPMLRSVLTDFGRGQARTFTITGLPPGALYDIWLASYRDLATANERTFGRWTANNPTSSNSVQFIDNRDGRNGTTFVEGYNYIVFQSVVADESGQISFAGKGMMPADGADDEYRLGLSGFQVVPVGKAVITSFSAPGATAVINQSAKTINLKVPFGTNLETLAPTFTLSSGTSNQTSGAPPSPTFAVQNPATYTVTDIATEPDTVNAYTVTVSFDQPVGTLVIDLGSTPGTQIPGGTFIGSGPTNLPIPELPAGSILRSIAMDGALVATDNDNFASDLSVLLYPNPGNPGADFSLEITNGTAPFGATASLSWPAAANTDVPGTPLVDTKTDADWTALGNIDLATTGLFLGNAYRKTNWLSPQGGTWSGTITLTYDLVGVGSAFQNWSDGEPFGGDKNGDGVSNGLAFLLGSANPSANTLGRLPKVSNNGGGLVLTFSMLNAAGRGPAALDVQWTSDLGQADPWAANVAAVPETSGVVNGVNFVITPNGGLNDVVATIPAGEAAAGKLFGRVKGSEN